MEMDETLLKPRSYSPGITSGSDNGSDTHNLVPFRYFELYLKGDTPNQINCKGQALVHKQEYKYREPFTPKVACA